MAKLSLKIPGKRQLREQKALASRLCRPEVKELWPPSTSLSDDTT